MANSTLTLVFQTGFALPVERASFTIKDATGNTVYSGEVAEGSSGISEPAVLSAPSRALTLTPDTAEVPYSTYSVEVSAEGYYNAVVRGVQMFADSPSRQVINLLPLPRSGVSRGGLQVYEVGPHALRMTYTPLQESGVGRILERVVVPESITVHLGAPNSSARNVTVPFIDYIKNVASSEIYPTWPEESLRANILAQISLALNRIYTEWYPARGYSFNITNSTAYDQYFVYGRNIYDSVSRIADELFATYIRKPGREEPFYAEYCNGSTVSCPGMSQWGTVALAQNGAGAEQILEFYYGNLDLVTSNNVEEIPESYPGRPLTIGSSGDAVLTMQIQLDRIAINYPAIPLVFADGVFGPNTRESVRAFQRIAGLSPDGIVGRATWYAISHYYVAVKKLAELKSEGELPVYNDFRFPGTLRRGSRGTSVQTLQFFLNTLAAYNPSIPTQQIDGIYGAATERAVQAAQTFYGIAPDGIVGPVTWETLVDAYRGAQDVPVPPEGIITRPYPGTPVRRGDRGSDVSYVQGVLNRIREVFVQIPRLTVDGVYGALTENAVRIFQRIFGLSADGVVGRNTWNRLNEILVSTDCVYESDTAAYTRPYPGSLVRRGQQGLNVRYVQTALSAIRRVLAFVPALSVDGVFGAGTERSVIAFQQIFGLVDDGIVGERTWEKINYLYVAVTDGCLSPAVSAAVTEEVALLTSAAPVSDGEGEGTEEGAGGEKTTHRTLRLGCFGQDVLCLKRALCEKGVSTLAVLGENLLFGLSTRCAVERFQAEHGLSVSGEADGQTRRRLGLDF